MVHNNTFTDQIGVNLLPTEEVAWPAKYNQTVVGFEHIITKFCIEYSMHERNVNVNRKINSCFHL